MTDRAFADLHCDLLSYLRRVPAATPMDTGNIGCAIPFLRQGNVKLQVMAIYTAVEKGSTEHALTQCLAYRSLALFYNKVFFTARSYIPGDGLASNSGIGIIPAIENASGFCEEDEPLENGFKKLEEIIRLTGRILYIGLTHHGENRFGGGNNTKPGLKPDGERLLDYISGRKIAIDFAHTSDALAYDLLNYITKHSLDIPVIASHSNYRAVWNHVRNLPDDIAKEIIRRDGLIGVNFLRAFLNDNDPGALNDHIMHGLALGGEKAVCIGADYFYTGTHPDKSRIPFYFKEHEHAGCYPSIIDGLPASVSEETRNDIAYRNVMNFLSRIWG